MKFGRFIRYCFLRGHRWVGADGKAFKLVICDDHVIRKVLIEDCSGHGYGNRSKTYKDVETHSGKLTRKKDRVCADCELVQLNESAPKHRESVAAHQLALAKKEAEKAKCMEIAAAKSGPHKRALDPTEQKIENEIRETVNRGYAVPKQKVGGG